MRVPAALLLAAALGGVAGQPLTLQPCNGSQPAQRLAYAGAGGTLEDGLGRCITGGGAGIGKAAAAALCEMGATSVIVGRTEGMRTVGKDAVEGEKHAGIGRSGAVLREMAELRRVSRDMIDDEIGRDR